MGKDVKYVLELSEEQARALQNTAELYARLRLGQWSSELPRLCIDLKAEDFCRKRDEIAELLDSARKIAMPELPKGASYGVGRIPDADKAWELYTVLRYAMAWHEHPEGGIGVCFDKPRSYSGEPLPTCTVVRK